MKGKVIDYNFFEAFVALEDDTIMKMSLSQVPGYLNVGDTINIDTTSISCAPSNKPKITQDKIVDFF